MPAGMEEATVRIAAPRPVHTSRRRLYRRLKCHMNIIYVGRACNLRVLASFIRRRVLFQLALGCFVDCFVSISLFLSCFGVFLVWRNI